MPFHDCCYGPMSQHNTRLTRKKAAAHKEMNFYSTRVQNGENYRVEVLLTDPNYRSNYRGTLCVKLV